MNNFPCGNTRREFIWQMGGGFAGLALTSLLDRDGIFGRHVAAAELNGPLAGRPSHIPTKAKACIFLMMNGAASQVTKNGVSNGLEKSQQESRKKIFEFDFCLVRGRDSTGVLDFLGMGFSVR